MAPYSTQILRGLGRPTAGPPSDHVVTAPGRSSVRPSQGTERDTHYYPVQRSTKYIDTRDKHSIVL